MSKNIIDKMNKFRENNNIIIKKFNAIEEVKTAQNIDCCSSAFYLKTYQQKNKHTEETKKQKVKPFFLCKNKFCSNCCYLRSKKLFVETYKVVENIKVKKSVDFLPFHLTLTVKNPTIEEYNHYQKIMNKAFILFMKKSSKYKFKNFVLGYQASRETTQSKEAKTRNELHPHIHILLLMSVDFAYKNNSYKLTQKEILSEWNSCLKHYDPDFPESTQIAFKKIKSKTEVEALEYGTSVDLQNSAIAEVSKYPVKISDLTQMSDNHFEVLNNALYHTRLITYGGLVKQVRAELKINDNEVKDMFLNQEEYELIKVELFNLFCGTQYQKKEMDIIDKTVYNEISKSTFFQV